jgi:hypothetical protein
MAKDAGDVNLDDIKLEIEKSKAQMAVTIEDLKSSLVRKRRLAEDKVIDQTAKKTALLWGDIDRTSRDVGKTLLVTARDNPLPLTVMGVGLGWLVVEKIRGNAEAERKAEEITVGEVYPGHYEIKYPEGAAWEAAGEYGYYAQQRKTMEEAGVTGAGRLPRNEFRRFVEDHPMAVGIGALALGMMIGLIIPETRREHEIMGEAKEDLIERTKQIGRTAAEESKKALHEAVEKTRDEADKSIKQAIHTAKEEVKGAARHAADATTEEIRKQTGADGEDIR